MLSPWMAAAPLPARVSSATASASDFSTRGPDLVSTAAPSWLPRSMALEYGEAFDFPVWITRCGVLAGAGQFGTPGPGHFRLLDQRASAPPAAALHRLRRHRPPGARRLSSARSGGLAGSRRCARAAQRRAARLYGRRRPGQRDVARAAHGLVRRTLRHAMRRQPDSRPRLYDIPWMVMDNPATPTAISAGESRCRCPKFSKRSPSTPRAIRTGWNGAAL